MIHTFGITAQQSVLVVASLTFIDKCSGEISKNLFLKNLGCGATPINTHSAIVNAANNVNVS